MNPKLPQKEVKPNPAARFSGGHNRTVLPPRSRFSCRCSAYRRPARPHTLSPVLKKTGAQFASNHVPAEYLESSSDCGCSAPRSYLTCFMVLNKSNFRLKGTVFVEQHSHGSGIRAVLCFDQIPEERVAEPCKDLFHDSNSFLTSSSSAS